ncbi:hypothetical protein CspHIS471_0407110 [Cutaneotrichosporon sp. HIS471]|nr:hypothetical protein CspHIS471_0407110 [Cutaneotrichosporon sp. HIS471]
MYPFVLLLLTCFGLALAVPNPEPPTKLQPRAPQASKRMGQRRRRGTPEKKDYSSFLCPAAAIACPITDGGELNELADWFRVGFECIEPETELNQCGGCVVMGKGQDCSTIANTRATACQAGTCVILSCKDGFVSDGKACVRPSNLVVQ